MRQLILVSYLFIILFTTVGAQGLTDSNLPIVIINIDGGIPILDNPRVRASMKIIRREPGERNYTSDQNNPLYLNYEGRIDIKIRGSSSKF